MNVLWQLVFTKAPDSFLMLSAILTVPLHAHALSLIEARETTLLFLYGIVGFFGGVAVALFCGGLGLYFVRLGTEQRVEGIHIMIWGVRILLYVICLLFIVAVIE